MEAVIAVSLRDRARAAMLENGGRGFMRFAPEGNALLATDALRRCEDQTQRTALIAALEGCGFVCREDCGLLLLHPNDEWIGMLQAKAPDIQVDWNSPLHPVQALAARWAAQPAAALTEAGRRLVADTLRLTGLPGGRVTEGLDALRAQAAVMLRSGDRSGMCAAGCVLWDWCEKEEHV